MDNNRITLKEAIKFHGHLGPWLVLGVLMGEYALKKIKAEKYFDLDIKVWGAHKKPKSCLIDGLQLSTGATYGKGNIKKLDGSIIKIEFCNRLNRGKIILTLKEDLMRKLEGVETHRDSELLAKQLYKTDYFKIFHLTPST